MLWAVSRAPLAKLQAYKRRMGWSFPWASSFDSDFNSSVTEEQQRLGLVEYNYRTEDVRPRLEAGKEGPLAEFAAGGGRTGRRSRGSVDGLWGMYQWLDRRHEGVNEKGIWFRRQDEYDKR